ncbi:MAG: hypothetical protein Q8P28_04360 [Deltaproteobacteria bacterium]|nr:hypothetical protein [Deltaproteobacteria bacterium]
MKRDEIIIGLIKEAMECLESMPCGCIGEDGATQEELYEATYYYNGDANCDDDANYHPAQQAWLLLKKCVEW